MTELERLGRYTLGEKLGAGGMGVVFRAQADGAEGFTKAVAIKTIHDAYAADPGIREMFASEARTAQRLQHGNIVQILDVGIDGDVPFLVIELVDGTSLAALLAARKGALPIADALYIAEGVASALAYAHGLTDATGRADGVVHRDVTPRNILVSRDGVVKLADFGIAKALSAPTYTLPGTFKGSLGYLAPEQAQGKAIDPRADQFAFGVVLYEMLAGKNPIAARDIEAYAATIERGVPRLEPAPPIDDELAAIVARATAIDPSARYPSMDELRGELEAWRVARKVRTSNDSLRDTLRALLAEDATVPMGRALGALLPLDTDATRQASAPATTPARASSRTRIAVIAAIALPVIAIAGWWFATRRDGTPVANHASGASAFDASDPSAHAATPSDSWPDASPRSSPDAGEVPAPDAPRTPSDAPTPTAAPDAAARPARKKGLVRIQLVPYAVVTIDGTSYGGVPVNVELHEGSHALVLENAELGQRVERTIRVVAGETLEVNTWQ